MKYQWQTKIVYFLKRFVIVVLLGAATMELYELVASF